MTDRPLSRDLPGVGARLRLAREDAGLSQAQVAALLRLSRPAISELESETRRLSAGELKRLAEVYRVAPEWLLGSDGAKEEEVRIAARQLDGLNEADREIVFRVIRSLRRNPGRE